jgi:proline-specific peptidase
MVSGDSSVEGRMTFRGHRVWYRVVGEQSDSGKIPLLCLHGGPGTPHDYMKPLARMAESGRRVIFYDQLGCGNSDRPDDPSLWTVDFFLDELRSIRKHLGLDQVHILGSSWGGMLAMEYALTNPDGLVSLILASAPSSIPLWIAEADRLREALPEDVQRVLRTHEDAGTTDEPEYQDAMMVFYHRHVCRLDPWPEYVSRSFDEMGVQVYTTMYGPSEFHATGALKDWDITDRLPEIRVPTLITSGAYDEATPVVAGTTHKHITDSEWVLFEHSSHMPFVEEPDFYIQVLGEFLDRVERERRS